MSSRSINHHCSNDERKFSTRRRNRGTNRIGEASADDAVCLLLVVIFVVVVAGVVVVVVAGVVVVVVVVVGVVVVDRKSTRLNSSHVRTSRMPSSA